MNKHKENLRVLANGTLVCTCSLREYKRRHGPLPATWLPLRKPTAEERREHEEWLKICFDKGYTEL